MTSDWSSDIRASLASNSLRFLVRATKAIPDSAHDALILGAAGVELALKARLAHEHWSLVVDRPGTRTLEQVQAGEFISVGFTDAMDRVAKVTGKAWNDADKNSLRNLANHRNKVLHFFHPGLDDEKLKEDATRELCQALATLKRTLEGPWSGISLFGAEMAQLDGALQQCRKYLQTVYDDLRPRLQAFEREGGLIGPCLSCEFYSFAYEPAEPAQAPVHLDWRCWVCGARLAPNGVGGPKAKYANLEDWEAGEESLGAASRPHVHIVVVDPILSDSLRTFIERGGGSRFPGRVFFVVDNQMWKLENRGLTRVAPKEGAS